jgi:hypothetical protein
MNLLFIHGDTHLEDDMAKVCHITLIDRTLGFLDEEMVLVQLGEDEVDMA